MKRIIFLLCSLLITSISATAQTATPTPLEFFIPEVLNVYPHDSESFTQGLLVHEGVLYESAGQEGESDLREVDIESGEVLRQVDVPAPYFAEGLALVDDLLIQLTWQQGEAFVYDLETFEQQAVFTYEGEGWGLCYDGDYVYRSDGTETITLHDPATFEVVDTLLVTVDGRPISDFMTPEQLPVSRLNELECVDGDIYANIWYSNFILRFDTASGEVTALIDASELLLPEERAELPSGAVLNGIAYHAENDTFLLTGKYWPKLFEVRLIPAS